MDRGRATGIISLYDAVFPRDRMMRASTCCTLTTCQVTYTLWVTESSLSSRVRLVHFREAGPEPTAVDLLALASD